MSAVAAPSIEIGSPQHRAILARFFMDTYIEYVPESVRWPALADADLERLASLPFWQEAVATENVTSSTVAAAAALEPDPGLRKAIELQGFEEQRHARLLAALTAQYRIKVTMPPPFEPRSLESDFLLAGFGECFDSFFAFGLFALAKDSKYRRSQLPLWRRPLFRLRCAWIILKQVASRAKTAREMNAGPPSSSDNFTLSAHQELGQDVTVHRLLELCLRENERRMAEYDARLVRPRLVPSIARFLYRILPARI